MSLTRLSVYISYLLRHDPDSLALTLDPHGWADVSELLTKVSAAGRYHLTKEVLDEIVRTDEKARFRYSDDGTRIKACQGHSLAWVEPELTRREPPEYLYHGTTLEAFRMILESGGISRMSRHAVHLQSEEGKAWQSAERWHRTPVVLKIHAAAMYADGMDFGVSDNGVWCTEKVPVRYITAVLQPGKE